MYSLAIFLIISAFCSAESSIVSNIVNSGKVLSVHNDDRHQHIGTGDLSASFSLSREAKSCAEYLATNSLPISSHPCPLPHGQGENLYYINAPYNSNVVTSVEALFTQAMNVWYNEERENFDLNQMAPKSPGISYGHFIQVVWKNTKQVGCAVAQKDDVSRSYVVCRYSEGVQFNYNNLISNIGLLIQQQPPCKDTASYCASIASHCGVVSQSFKDQCRKTCGLC